MILSAENQLHYYCLALSINGMAIQLRLLLLSLES